jgi:hypothetical protein
MIYECTNGHICFSKEEDLCICAVKECRKPTLIISPIDIEWFYKINDSGLCINRKDLEMIIKDRNMPREVKKIILRIFPYLMSQMYD